MPIPQKKLAAWIAELRKPENVQAQQVLAEVREGGTLAYCCLGLFCHKVEGIVPRVNVRDGLKVVTFAGEPSVLPLELTRTYGITANGELMTGHHDRDGEDFVLAAYNDCGITFPQIADLLEYFELRTEAHPA